MLEDLLKEYKSKEIKFTAIKLDPSCNKMCKIMQSTYPGLQVTDLGNAVTAGKSKAEVDKMFVDSASYILRAATGGSTGGSKKAAKRSASSTKPLWDVK